MYIYKCINIYIYIYMYEYIYIYIYIYINAPSPPFSSPFFAITCLFAITLENCKLC